MLWVSVEFGSVLFSVHPVMMSSSCVCMLSGLTVYRIGGVTTPLGTIRKRHAFVMGSAAVLAVVGVCAILANKNRLGKSWAPGTIHALLGLIGIGLMMMQVSVGAIKFINAGISMHSWHGVVGPMIAAVFACAACTGLWETSTAFSGKLILSMISTCLIVTVTVIRFRIPFMRTQEHGELTTEERQFQRAYAGGGSKGSSAAEFADDL
eukprot:TRINITY_DN8354_c0_g1_i6.p2 TRINITY_DN8354_c0_g1~~TRINITY_DN8354_c0_g1_i6.p2  ORF type:complete len:208 (-),score=36.09 TRINITY_DN8354_c0_g1_i6:236-859(-)